MRVAESTSLQEKLEIPWQKADKFSLIFQQQIAIEPGDYMTPLNFAPHLVGEASSSGLIR